MPRPTCGSAGGKRDDGKPCGTANGLQPDGRCFRHSRHTAHLLAQAEHRVKAGQKAHRRRVAPVTEAELPAELETPEDAQRWLAFAARNVAIGRLSHSQGQAISAAVREWLKAENIAGAARRAAALDSEVRKLQAELKRRRGIKAV